MKKRIVIVGYNPIAFDGRVWRTCRALCNDFNVVCVCPDGPYLDTNNRYSVITIEVTQTASNLMRYLRFSRCFLKLCDELLPDVIYAHDYYLALPGYIAASRASAKFIYDAHELIIPDPTRKFSVRGYFWYRLERFVISKADLVIAANEERAQLMRYHYNLKTAPLTVMNISERQSMEKPIPLPPKVEAAILRISQYKSFVYQGHVTLQRGLRKLIEAVKYLPPEYRFVVIGSGPDMAAVEQLAKQLKVYDRIIMLGRIQKKYLENILKVCKLGIVTYSYCGLNNIFCAPNKIFEYTQAGLAVLSTSQPPLRQMISEYSIGSVFKEDYAPEKLAEMIVDLVEGRSEILAKHIKTFLNDYNWDNESVALQKAVRSL